ncbi:fungal-specific transcription factor domain-containing protein [Mariannaea sp. PMI_226]|nr:fungal-specific transcription factor domain-containing protein [Mariannaea sp. PMI_226]
MDSSAANRDNNCERYEGVQLKRQRVSEACTRCRERKQRCDGLRPACAPCRSRGLAEACRYVGTRRPAAGAGQRNSREGRDPSLSLGSSSSSNGGGSGTTVESPRRSGESSSGPLSTAAFLRQILSDYDPESSSRTSQQTTGEVSQSSNGRHSDILSDRSPEEGISLSPEEILPSTITNLQFPTGAFDFIHCYWNFVHPFFPILHMIKFVKRYCATRMAELAASDPANSESQPEDSPPDKIFMSITNLVFALGCKLSERVPDRDKASMADLFYRNSRDLACDSTLDSATLESTQMLLLTGVYLQSTQHADRCWNTIGLAIRVAQGLGLDTEPDKLRKGPQLPREMSRRIWHTCVNLDRLVAMTCGRPTMIRSANQVPFPVIVDDEYLLDQYEGTQPNDVPCRFGLFPTASTLLELLKEVLELHSKYNPARVQEQLESANEKKKLVTSVMELNRRLDILSASIPEYLKENTANNPLGPHRGEIQVQRHILLCR